MDGIVRSTTYPKKFKFSELDFVSEGISVTLKGEDRVKTKIGACNTICLYALLIAAAFYFIRKYLDTTSPNIQYNVISVPEGNTLNITEDEIYFFVLVKNPDRTSLSKEAASITDVYGETGHGRPPGSSSRSASAFHSEQQSSAEVGTHQFEGKKRALQTASSPKGLYVDIESFFAFFNYTLNFAVREIKKTTAEQGYYYEDIRYISKKLIKCSDTGWFQKDKFREVLKLNAFTYDIISKYGLCFNMTDEVILFGEASSSKHSFIEFNISLCNSTIDSVTCSPNSRRKIKNSKYLSVTFGCLEPTIKNDDKFDPFGWNLNTDNIFMISAQLEVMTTVFLKRITTLTDVGTIIDSEVNQSKAAIHKVSSTFNSRLDLGSPIATPNPTKEFYTVFDNSNIFLSLIIQSSTTTEAFSRSYDKILDLFGSIGGTIDFILLLFIICFNWYENYIASLRMKRALGNHLGVPTKMKVRGYSIFNMCSKKNNKLKLAALDELAEEALSAERLAENVVLANVLKRYLLPKEVVRVAPTVELMGLMIEAKKAEQKPLEKKEQVSPPNLVDSSHSEDSQSPELASLADVLACIESIPVDSPSAAHIKASYLSIFRQFQKEFYDCKPENFFFDETHNSFMADQSYSTAKGIDLPRRQAEVEMMRMNAPKPPMFIPAFDPSFSHQLQQPGQNPDDQSHAHF